ncbi:MAG TPA: RuvA C-terminal domain-containing protein [Kofleriaceae bacterium]|nr:RuvA C-terminal domain-containing protein [Kofleriaceae bacterium]
MTSRPRAPKGDSATSADAAAATETAERANVSNHVRREVHDRDDERCAWVSEDGVRCGDRRFLEYEHRTLHCRGGQPTANCMALYCRAHNQYEAERQLGVEFMEAKRAEAVAERAAAEEEAAAVAAASAAAAAAAVAMRRVVDADVERALCGMGFKKAQAREAVKAIAEAAEPTVEARLRAALGVLSRTRGSRSSEGAFDVAWGSTAAPVPYGAVEFGPGAKLGREPGPSCDQRT